MRSWIPNSVWEPRPEILLVSRAIAPQRDTTTRETEFRGRVLPNRVWERAELLQVLVEKSKHEFEESRDVFFFVFFPCRSLVGRVVADGRSEERRVGKECRSRWS